MNNAAALLSKNDLEFYEVNGYAIAHEAFANGDLEEIRAAIDRLMEQGQELQAQTLSSGEQIAKATFRTASFKFAVINDKLSLILVAGAASVEPVLLKHSRDRRLLETFATILGTRELEHIIVNVHPKLPGDGVGFDPHRDIENRLRYDSNWKDVARNGSCMIAVIAIDHCSEENGTLTVVPRSHVGYQFSPEESKLPTTLSDEDTASAITVELTPGSILFMHPYMIHWSGENKSERARYTLLSGFAAKGANSGEYPGDCTNVFINLDERDE